MSTFTQRYRSVFITLLLGLIVSAVGISAQAAGPPVANATVNGAKTVTGTLPFTVTFNGSLSKCPNGCTQPNSYVWDTGAGAFTPSGIIEKNTYAFNGVFNATLTVTDNLGLKSTAKVTVTVNLPPGESLTSYVQACQTQLNFQTIPDNINCYSGDLFAVPYDDPLATTADFDKNQQVRDYMGYRKITDQVDMVFACRWLQGDPVNNPSAPISIEMQVHNRSNGNTCFFSAKGFVSHDNNLTSSIIRSPTSSAATTFWDSPSAVNTYARCVGCHVEGPYISTPTIAPYLAKYGLLNNGHDTGSSITYDDLTKTFNTAHVKYHAVVTPNVATSVFSSWDSLKQSYMDPAGPAGGCSIGCHVIGTKSPQPSIGVNALGFESILNNPADEITEIFHADVMPPYYDEYSDYRWINLDTPTNSTPSAGVETENFADAMNATSTLVPNLALAYPPPNYSCPNAAIPGDMEAHAVGIDASNAFSYSQVSWITEKLRSFNLKDGLVCMNADQDPGVTCRDFDVSYLCSNGNWTGFYNQTINSGGGDDHEERSAINSQVVAACGNTQPVGIKARLFLAARGGPAPQVIIGPNDRLARFSQYGLTCNNSDQPDGQCSNYVVRYHNCQAPPTPVTRTLTSVFNGKRLTATSSTAVNGQPTSSSTTQQWVIEPVLNTEYVRLKNVSTNMYLNVTSTAETTTVITSASSTANGERWTVEPVTSSDFRLKNLGSGKYLTMNDTTNPNVIYSQTKNPTWTSQRWVIQ